MLIKVDTAKTDLPITHDTFRKKYDVTAISNKVQVLLLLRQHHNAAFWLLCTYSFGPQGNLSLRSLTLIIFIIITFIGSISNTISHISRCRACV